jgi:hypothetical protein
MLDQGAVCFEVDSGLKAAEIDGDPIGFFMAERSQQALARCHRFLMVHRIFRLD